MKNKIPFWRDPIDFFIIRNIKRIKMTRRKKQIKALPKYPVPGTIWIILEYIDTFEVVIGQEMVCLRVKAQEMINVGGIFKKLNNPLILQVWFNNSKKPERNCIYISRTPGEDFPLLGATFFEPYDKKRY
ncbi:hypothetical protein KKB58_01460 [Patescibacteria group bacterium]|nr:hypothetical protein [Patescibacteria group bacterium]